MSPSKCSKSLNLNSKTMGYDLLHDLVSGGVAYVRPQEPVPSSPPHVCSAGRDKTPSMPCLGSRGDETHTLNLKHRQATQQRQGSAEVVFVVLGDGGWVPGAGCWVLRPGCWLLSPGCWVLSATSWALGKENLGSDPSQSWFRWRSLFPSTAQKQKQR